MRRCSSVLLALGLVACGPGQPNGYDQGDDDGDETGLRVLFIGNSYTYTHDLPGMVESMAIADSRALTVESRTMEGAYLATHLGDPSLESLLERDFDVVVIQGYSLEPILDSPSFLQAIVEVVSMAGDARVLLFQTWPRHPDNPELVELGISVEQMWAGVENGYALAAMATDGEVARVGAAWMSALQLEPPIGLYASDGDHPSLAGSYLSASVIYGVIFDMPCSTNAYAPAQLAPNDADLLREIADTINGN